MYIKLNKCIERIGKPVSGIIHVGAWDGEEIFDYAANGVKRVVWLEANRHIMSELVRKTSSVTPYVKQEYVLACLSDAEGEEITFNIASNGQSSSILEFGTHAKMYPHITYTDKVKLTARRFDKLIEEFPIDIGDFDFINLDVQGAELKVLKGFGDLLNSPSLKAVYTEVNLEHVYKNCCLIEELEEYLDEYGFRRAHIACPEKTWGDALYIRE